MKSPEGHSCVIFGQPRSGNHALCSILTLLGMVKADPPGNFVPEEIASKIKSLPGRDHFMSGAHDICSSPVKLAFISSGHRGMFISRDLRDIAVSLTFFKRGPERFFGGLLLDMIPHVVKRYLQGIRWRDVDNVYSTTYERLHQQTPQEISNIIQHIGLSLSEERLGYHVEEFFNRRKTFWPQFFRKGIIGDWKNHFELRHKKLFKELAGEILISEGYEKDMEW